jgi:hypothetical protein
MTPFLIYALPRSRTAWLSEFLTYRDWSCGHELAIQMRNFDEVLTYFRRPNVGSAEPAAGPGWRLMQHHFPHMRSVVIRRPVEDVVKSMMRVDVDGVAVYDRDKLRRTMERSARDLDALSMQPGVLTVDFDDLAREDACAAVFEHCLPYPFDRTWWGTLCNRNIQINVKALLRYYFANKAGVDGFKRACKTELRRLAYAGLIHRKEFA